MGQSWAFFAIVSAVLWNAMGGTCQAPAPAPTNSSTVLTAPNYQPYEADAIYGMLKAWNASGTNVSALMPSWSSNRIHPCDPSSSTADWITCSSTLVHVLNLSSYTYTLTSMAIVGPDDGGVEIVGEMPTSILNLTNLQQLSITGQRKLFGPLPTNILNRAIEGFTSISFRGCNLSGNIILSNSPGRIVQLDTLDLSDNSFTGQTPFCQNAKQYMLTTLNISNNRLTGPFCNNESAILQSLDISNNQFSDVIVRKDAFLLEFIYAQNNRIERLPSQILKLPRLQEIYLDSNNLSGTLDLPNVFPSNSSLRLISLLNNNITAFNPSTDDSSLLSRSNLARLELLFLGGNPVCQNAERNTMMQMVCRFNRTSPLEGASKDSNKVAIIVGVCMGVIALLAFLATLFVYRKLHKKSSLMEEILSELEKQDVKPNLYSYTELKNATEDFHIRNELGKGGFGVLYKGVLPDGSKVAVKKLLNVKEESNIQDFLNEIIVISNIKHRNLVQLKGCCIKENQRILVYELVDNNNLATALWERGPNKDHLDWGSRFNIILGIARGLAYLHEEIKPTIIHRDIKSQNILLDKYFNPKIADFGLALLVPSLDDGETHVNLSTIAGTMGYFAPEYLTYGQVSTKLDVFSFGVLVLEIVSGRANMDAKAPPEQMRLTYWAQNLHKENEIMSLLDKSLQEVTTSEDAIIRRVVEIGLLCLHHVPSRRPTMSDVISMLIGNKEIDQVALHEYHQLHTQDDGCTSSSIPSIELSTTSGR